MPSHSEKDDIFQRLEIADGHLERADEELSAIADVIEECVSENLSVESETSVPSGKVTIRIDHSATLPTLNDKLPSPYIARKDEGQIEVVRVTDIVDLDGEELPDVSSGTLGQRDRIKNIKQLVSAVEDATGDGAPEEVVIEYANAVGLNRDKAADEIEKLRRKGEVYEPIQGHLRTT